MLRGMVKDSRETCPTYQLGRSPEIGWGRLGRQPGERL